MRATQPAATKPPATRPLTPLVAHRQRGTSSEQPAMVASTSSNAATACFGELSLCTLIHRKWNIHRERNHQQQQRDQQRPTPARQRWWHHKLSFLLFSCTFPKLLVSLQSTRPRLGLGLSDAAGKRQAGNLSVRQPHTSAGAPTITNCPDLRVKFSFHMNFESHKSTSACTHTDSFKRTPMRSRKDTSNNSSTSKQPVTRTVAAWH